MIELRENERLVVAELAQKYLVKGTELWVYGSRVQGTALDTSKLNLMLFTPEGEVNNLNEFLYALQNSDIMISVRVQDWKYLPVFFRDNFRMKNECLLVV